jgi:transposase
MLNKKEQEKLDIIKCYDKGMFTAEDAAQRLKLKVRQMRRLVARYRKGVSLLHGNCGKLPSNTLDVAQQEAILKEYQLPCYKDVNFKHFTELISDKPFAASYTAVTKVLKDNGITSPKARRKKKKEVHKTRERRSKFGELLQTDGTPHDWFNTGRKQCLHVLIDDTTGMLVGLFMAENECLHGYFEITRQVLEKYGTPEAFYADGLSVFFSKNSEKDLTIEDQLAGITKKSTQFGSICDELGIDLIHAHSPQAKGRVERVNETLQSRLPVEFAIRNITTIDEANKFLVNKYMDMFNAQFAVNTDAKSCFVPLPSTVDLDALLTHKESRKTDSGCCFSYKNVTFRVNGLVINKSIEVLVSKRIGIIAKYDDKFFDVTPISENKKEITSSDSHEMIVAKFVHFFTLKNEHVL